MGSSDLESLRVLVTLICENHVVGLRRYQWVSPVFAKNAYVWLSFNCAFTPSNVFQLPFTT